MSSTEVLRRRMRFVFEVEDVIQCSEASSRLSYFPTHADIVWENNSVKVFDSRMVDSTLVEEEVLYPGNDAIEDPEISQILGRIAANKRANGWRQPDEINNPHPLQETYTYNRVGQYMYVGRNKNASIPEPQHKTKLDTRWRLPAWTANQRDMLLLQPVGGDWVLIYRALSNASGLYEPYDVVQCYAFKHDGKRWAFVPELNAFLNEIKPDLLMHTLSRKVQ